MKIAIHGIIRVKVAEKTKMNSLVYCNKDGELRAVPQYINTDKNQYYWVIYRDKFILHDVFYGGAKLIAFDELNNLNKKYNSKFTIKRQRLTEELQRLFNKLPLSGYPVGFAIKPVSKKGYTNISFMGSCYE